MIIKKLRGKNMIITGELKNKIDKNKMEKYVWKKQIVKKVKK